MSRNANHANCNCRDGFYFRSIGIPHAIRDAIVIKQTPKVEFGLPDSDRTLEEHIEFINENHIEKAIIIADDIRFVLRCPTLKYLVILPRDSAGNGYDYSPLYEAPEIRYLECRTEYGERERYQTSIDYSRVRGLERLEIRSRNELNYDKVPTLRTLDIRCFDKSDLSALSCSKQLDTLELTTCRMKSLDGIGKHEKMQCLYLYYNRSLRDISALSQVKNTLRALWIEHCPKIEDFAVLNELERLELLTLSGSNAIPNLDFLKSTKNLKTFILGIDVLDGDLSRCRDLSYVYSERNRKHYNVKDKDLPRGLYVKGNEDIDEWRRLY